MHPLPLATLVLLAIVAGCGESGPASKGDTADTRAAEATRASSCAIGERPDYFVSGPDPDDPHAIIGCARLGASGKPVEFSAHAEADYFRGDDYLCLNPAYRGRGELGIYIPDTCWWNPLPRELEVLSVEIPTQAVRDYQLVIWGVAEPSTRRVVARHDKGDTPAVVFNVTGNLARAVGAKRPFGVFVVELFPEAACRPIHVRAHDRSGAETERIGTRPNLCEAR